MNQFNHSKFMSFKVASFNIFILLVSSLLFSCEHNDVFEKNVTIPDFQWKSDNSVQGDLDIMDTTASYNIYVCIRHTDAYKYNNLWIEGDLIAQGDSILLGKKNLTLGNDQSGWEGSGMDDIWDVRKKITESPVRFKKKGKYHFNLRQIMRDDPLPAIMSIGMRIEKVNL